MFVSVIIGSIAAADWIFDALVARSASSVDEVVALEVHKPLASAALLSASSLAYFDGYKQSADATPPSKASASDVRPRSHQLIKKQRQERIEYFWSGPQKGASQAADRSAADLKSFEADCVAGCYRRGSQARDPRSPIHVHQPLRERPALPTEARANVMISVTRPHRAEKTIVVRSARANRAERRRACGRKCREQASRKTNVRQQVAWHAPKPQRTRKKNAARRVVTANRWPQSSRVVVRVDTRRYFDSYRPATRRGGWGWAR